MYISKLQKICKFYFLGKSTPLCPRPHWINDGTCDEHEIDSVFKLDICRFDGGDCCKKHLIANGVCDEVNNFESCGNFDGGDCKGKFEKMKILKKMRRT